MNALERIHNGNLSKVERYGWSIADQPGRFTMLPKEALLIDDDTYQRVVDDKDGKVLRIASEWSWVACGAIIVAQRGSSFYVIDGQHRKRAADRRSDIRNLPCLVFQTDGPREEAAGFLRANKERKAMTAAQSFNAKLTAGIRSAVVTAELVRSIGRRVQNNTDINTVRCVGAVMKCVEGDEAALRRIWPLVAKVCEGTTFRDNILLGAFYIETHLPTNESLASKPWGARFVALGADELSQSISKARAYYAGGGAKIYARGITQAINKGMKTRRLVLTTDEAEAG